jgi:hypothetical protein
VHDEPPVAAEQRRDVFRRGAQQQPYECRGPVRSRAALVFAGEEGEEYGGDRGDGVVAGGAVRGGDP